MGLERPSWRPEGPLTKMKVSWFLHGCTLLSSPPSFPPKNLEKMAAKTLLRSGNSIVTRFLSTGSTQFSSNLTHQIQSKLLITPSLSNLRSLLFSPQNDTVSSNITSSHGFTFPFLDGTLYSPSISRESNFLG